MGFLWCAGLVDTGKIHKMPFTLVVVRHGESEWNKVNKFCGWYDADLSELGVEEAKRAGQWLKEANLSFDVAYTSVLKRAIKTLFFIQDEMDLHWIPVTRDWHLNERMYGGLTGLNKAETAAKHGEAQVKIWRRSYDIPPPVMDADNEYHPSHDRRYDGIPVPSTECLKDTVERFIPYYLDVIAPHIRAGKRVLISAHGNSLRALVKYLENIDDDVISNLNIPTGIPLVYELDDDLKFVSKRYLADEATVAAAEAAVANQGKAAK